MTFRNVVAAEMHDPVLEPGGAVYITGWINGSQASEDEKFLSKVLTATVENQLMKFLKEKNIKIEEGNFLVKLLWEPNP